MASNLNDSVISHLVAMDSSEDDVTKASKLVNTDFVKATPSSQQPSPSLNIKVTEFIPTGGITPFQLEPIPEARSEAICTFETTENCLSDGDESSLLELPLRPLVISSSSWESNVSDISTFSPSPHSQSNLVQFTSSLDGGHQSQQQPHEQVMEDDEDIEMETSEDDTDDVVDMDAMDELEEILNRGMKQWILAYYQMIELKQQFLMNNTDGVITCSGPENNHKGNGDKGCFGTNNNHNTFNKNNDQSENRQNHKRRRNDKNEDDGDEERKSDDHHGHKYHVHPSQCNHLTECEACSEQIGLYRGIIHNLQQQQEYHSSFIRTMDEIIQNGSNGNNIKHKHKNKKKYKLKKNKSDRNLSNGVIASYEPVNSFRAKGQIKIAREFTNTVLLRRTMENITNFYHYLDKTIALNHNNQQIMNANEDQKDDHDIVINLDLHDATTKEALYCVIQRNDVKKSQIYPYKMVNRLFTASDIQCPLPTSSRQKFQIEPEMKRIRDYLKSPKNLQMILKHCKLHEIPVFDKKKQKTTQRMALFITPQKLHETITDYILHYKTTIIPIAIFGDNNKHWIEYIIVIDSYSFGSIGVSLCFDKRGNLCISSIHLNWTAIQLQHEIAVPHHMKECECFKGVNPVIDDIRVGNPDDVENKMKSYQSRYQMVAEVLHKVQDYACKYIDNFHSKQNERIYPESPSLSATHSEIIGDVSSSASSDASWND